MSKEFCKSFKEAEDRYKTWKSVDPFPNILPALLNSADIADYVRQTGMIYPFHEEDLRGATYRVRLKGLCVSFEEDPADMKVKQSVVRVGDDLPDLPNADKNLSDYPRSDEKIVVKPNSITYLTLEPVFQIPDYMALRFNLKISHVYKGLLLGTGPIIDPGFRGRLSIPLHNLTSNEYVFTRDEEMIMLEFTKMSASPRWKKLNREEARARYGEYVPNDIPMDRQVDEYIQTALKLVSQKTVVSSIISVTRDVKETANKARENVDRLQRRFSTIGWIALMGLIAAIAALLIPTYQLIKSVDDTQASYSERIGVLEETLEEKERELEDIQRRFKALEDTVANVEGVRDEN